MITLDCPFCGSKDHVMLTWLDQYYYMLHCLTCGAEGGKRTSPAAALDAWNTRSRPATPLKAIPVRPQRKAKPARGG